MPFNFPPADPNAWATWNVTFEANTSTPEKSLDKSNLLNSIEGAIGPLPPDSDGATVEPRPNWSDLDGEHSQLKVELLRQDGNKTSRGIVRPPAVSKPPASRVVAVELAR